MVYQYEILLFPKQYWDFEKNDIPDLENVQDNLETIVGILEDEANGSFEDDEERAAVFEQTARRLKSRIEFFLSTLPTTSGESES